MHSFIDYVNPSLGKMLEKIKMDKSYIKGEGCWLYDSSDSRYLDCIASYGALPFGYNPPGIWECIMDFHQSKEPSFIQPSMLNAAGELAKRLIELAPEGLKYVTFTNSGTETVEAAIKLCRSASGRIGILSTQNSFHGKTLGALSATGKSSYQSSFGAPAQGFNHVNFGDLDALEMELNRNPNYYAAFIVEPIQGEGGIVEPPEGYLKAAKQICRKCGVFLIADEIQTGLGRTGDLFACSREGLYPDVLLLSKALGGGIIPIGACLCTEEVYNEEFALKHSSTFAANSLACRVGIKVLDMLTHNDGKVLDNVRENGALLKSRLSSLRDKYPHIIKSIRGKGFMLGIEFGIEREAFPGSLLGIMAEQDLLAPVISSYLLNNEKLRVAPTLNRNNVIRIEPPLIMASSQCTMISEGIENMLKILSTGNTASFLSYLIGAKATPKHSLPVHKEPSKSMPQPHEGEGRFAFLVHPVDIKNYSEFDESLSLFSEDELEKLTDIWSDMVEPFVISKTSITSKCGKKAYGEFIAIPKTADQLMNLPKEQVLSQLKSAVNLARERGAKIVGLGAYTSVVSAGGLYLKDQGIPLTTGNSYTVVSAVDAITSALDRLGIRPECSYAAVVGAAGSIGRGVSILLSEKVSKLMLIGSPKNEKSSRDRLYKVAAEIYKYISALIKEGKCFKSPSAAYRLSRLKDLPEADSPLSLFVDYARKMNKKNGSIIISTSIEQSLPMADAVVSATSSIGKIIGPENLKYGAVVCDMSRPSNVSPKVSDMRPDVLVIDGGIIEVPGLPSLGWNFGFDQGLAYACMSETMMLALEHHYTHTSIGSSGISLENILYTRHLAQKHGFKLANFKSFNKPLTDEIWERIASRAFDSTGTP